MATSAAKRPAEVQTGPAPKKFKTRLDDENHPTRLVLDPKGDVLLKVKTFFHYIGEFRLEEKDEFLVSSKALSLSTPVFDAMLNGPFAEGQIPEFGLREIPLDDPGVALCFVLFILHFRVKELNLVMDTDDLYDVAILCDKYDLTSVVRPMMVTVLDDKEFDIDDAFDEKALMVAWTFGLPKPFRSILINLAKGTCFQRVSEPNAEEDDENEEPEIEPTYDLDVVVRRHWETDEHGGEHISLPEVVEDVILKVRSAIFTRIKRASDKYKAGLLDNVRILSGDYNFAGRSGPCYRAELGDFVLSLVDSGQERNKNSWTPDTTANEVLDELLEFTKDMERSCSAEDECNTVLAELVEYRKDLNGICDIKLKDFCPELEDLIDRIQDRHNE